MIRLFASDQKELEKRKRGHAETYVSTRPRILIFASGNVVHNLAKIDWRMDGGHPWAVEFDDYIKEKVKTRQYDDVVHYEQAGQSAKLAFFTPEHFYPLLYILGASREDDRLKVFSDSCTLGSLSMTCYLFA